MAADLLAEWEADVLTRRLYPQPPVAAGDTLIAPHGTLYRVLWVRGQRVRVAARQRRARGRAVPAVTISLDEAMRRRV